MPAIRGPQQSRSLAHRVCSLLTPLVAAGACAYAPAPIPGTPPMADPRPDSVDAVVFLVGDAGEADGVGSPVLQKLANEVESWSESLARDSAVAVVFLGGNVYPNGYNDPSEGDYPRDSVRLGNEIATVTGPQARAYLTPAIFISGNHDWANTSGPVALARLRNLETRLQRERAAGTLVELMPGAGLGGPEYVDLGQSVRIVFLDTQWWLAEGQDERGILEAYQRLAEVMADSDDRDVIVAAHHPMVTGGEHGGALGFRSTVGVRWLLSRTGAIRQDLTSLTYQGMIGGFREAFSRGGAPLVYAAGHDHNLQVIAAVETGDPEFTLVSGSGSKLSTPLRRVPGMHFGVAAPGYMRVVFRRDGAVDVFVISGPRSFTACPEDATPEHDCLTLWPTAFRVVYSQRLKPAP